jgi:hypothetical protein
MWSQGDVIGTLIDFDSKEISFYRNDKCLGVAFKRIRVGPNMAYFPAISLSGGQRVIFNFGQTPFKFRNNFDWCAINEPECHIKHYHSTALYLVETIKRYVIIYFEYPMISED